MKVLWLCLLLAACGTDGNDGNDGSDGSDAEELPPLERPKRPKRKGGPPTGQPKFVRFDHIVISFAGADRNVEAYRPQEEARRLAYEVLDKVNSGIDWDQLKQRFSDDRARGGGSANGPYTLINYGLRHRAGDIPRASYGKRLGDVAFTLKVGGVGMADYDEKDCPSGWHIIKRLE